MRENIVDEILKVVQAFKDEEIIECAPLYTRYQKFSIATKPCWDFKNFFYRVKAKPLEVWVNITTNGNLYSHDNEQLAKDRGVGCPRIAVHMKEVE